MQKRFFDLIYSTKATGTGLGLSIAARIFEMHGRGFAVQKRLVAEGFRHRTAAQAIQ